MKNLLKFSSLALMVMVLMTACETDPEPTDLGPTVSFGTDTGFLSADADLAASEVFKVQISAISGEVALKTLTVFEDGAKLPTDRFDVNGDPAAANPLLVVSEDDKISFLWTVSITAQATGTVNYEFEVEDDSGLKDVASIVISIGANDPPKLTFTGDGMFTADAGGLVSIAITADIGGAALSTLGVYEDGVLVGASRLRLDDVEFTANPEVLTEGQKTGFSANLIIRASDTEGTLPYTVELTDEAGLTEEISMTINTGTTGTPVTETVAIMVANADGPNQGGLDLDGGISVASASGDAELRDLGIDNGPVATNWIRQVESVNGAVLRTPGSGQPEGFKYENITSVEAIQAAFDAGTTVTTSTQTIAVGDVFLVSNNGKVWILETANVNLTSDNNEDFYEFNVKGE